MAGYGRCGAAFAVLLVVLVAGCGSSAPGSREYGDQVAQTQARYERAVHDVRDRGQQALVSDEGSVTGVYASMLEATRAARADYARLQPPDDLRADHGRLVDLLDQQVAVLERVLAAVSAQDGAGLAGALKDLAGVLAGWADANQQLKGALASTQ